MVCYPGSLLFNLLPRRRFKFRFDPFSAKINRWFLAYVVFVLLFKSCLKILFYILNHLKYTRHSYLQGADENCFVK